MVQGCGIIGGLCPFRSGSGFVREVRVVHSSRSSARSPARKILPRLASALSVELPESVGVFAERKELKFQGPAPGSASVSVTMRSIRSSAWPSMRSRHGAYSSCSGWPGASRIELASRVADPEEIEICQILLRGLYRTRPSPPPPELTVREQAVQVGKLAGFLPTRRQPLPGTRLPWLGMVESLGACEASEPASDCGHP